MKRYELAKNAGLNWQAVLIEDLQTDLKLLIMQYVKQRRTFGEINTKVNKMIDEAAKTAESDTIKSMIRNSMPVFASKIYIKAVELYSFRTAPAFIYAFSKAHTSLSPISSRVAKRVALQPPQGDREFGRKYYNRAVPNGMEPKEYQREVVRRMNEIADSVAKTDYSERTSVRASAERELRWEWHEKQLQDYQDKGVDLVWIDTHANCSERCQKWQGKLYSISGRSGEIDGIKFQPLTNATDHYYTTKAGRVWKNGCLSGFGCRHKTIPYKKGFKPIPIPEKVIERERAIDQTQRAMERGIRKAESRALLYKKDKAMQNYYRFYKAKAQTLTDEYIAYSKKNNVAYYPSRIDI